MAKKGFLDDIHSNSPLAHSRSPYKKNDPTKLVRIAVPLYEKIRKIAFEKHKRVSEIATNIVDDGFRYRKMNNKQ